MHPVFAQVHAQLTAVFRQPGVIEVDHRRDHAPVIVAKTVDVLAVERARRIQGEVALEILKPEEQPAIERLAQTLHQIQITVAGLGLARVDPLDVVATNALANLRKRPTAYRCRRQFALGLTFAALGRQLTGQTRGQENVLLRPAMLGQVVDDT